MNLLDSTSLADKMADLHETLEKGKVALTPQVRAYLEFSFSIVQDKLQTGQPVMQEDLVFIEKVKMWIRMAEEDREKYPAIEDMELSDECQEANKRNISTQQWLDLLHMAEAVAPRRPKEWIDEKITFEGGKIICATPLHFINNNSLKFLPLGLRIGGYCDFVGCDSLTYLPSDIHAEHLALFNCGGLIANKSEVLPLLWDKLNKGEIGGLSLNGWPLEDGDIPDNLHVRNDLILNGCKDITSLPSGLHIGRYCDLLSCISITSLPDDLTAEILQLSRDMNPKVIQDAERLKREGKIKDIQYV